MTEQQSARVNVDDEAWVAFRVLAVRDGRSIAEYLGELVAEELRRRARVDASTVEGAGVRDPSGGQSADRDTKLGAGEDADRARSPSRLRLSDVELLDRLPGSGPPT